MSGAEQVPDKLARPVRPDRLCLGLVCRSIHIYFTARQRKSVVTDKRSGSRPGRPRRFDVDDALTTGQALFHAKGYDAVGIAELTEAIGIRSPSFYAAFGSKAAYFHRILTRYETAAAPTDAIPEDGRPMADVLTDLFVFVAHAYSASPTARGCLVIETLRASGDPQILKMVRSMADARSRRLQELVGRSYPDAVQAVDDYVFSALSGLSACARQGWSLERLISIAHAASAGAASLLT